MAVVDLPFLVLLLMVQARAPRAVHDETDMHADDFPVVSVAAQMARNGSRASIALLQEQQDSGFAVTLTVLSLVGLYMGIASKTIEAKATMQRDGAFDGADQVMQDVLRSYKMFSKFFRDLEADLKQMPEQWNERNGGFGAISTVQNHLPPFPEIGESGTNPLEGSDMERMFLKGAQGQAEGIMWTVVGQTSQAAGAATSIFGFVTSLGSLSKAIYSHVLTSKDAKYVKQTQMFRMMLRAEEANTYMQFCSFVKATWEQALGEKIMSDGPRNRQWSDFNLEKATHVAGEMQRMWRCHCLDKVSRRSYDENFTHQNRISLQLVEPAAGFHDQNYPLFSPGDAEGVRLSVKKMADLNKKFVTDIQVVYRKCKVTAIGGRKGVSQADTTYERYLQAQGYTLLTPRITTSGHLAKIDKVRHKDCLTVADGGGATRTADIQQLSNNRDASVVLIYIKENVGGNNIPINDVMVAYGKINADRAVVDGWTLLPVPVYHDTSTWSNRLNAKKAQPFILFKRQPPIVPCPTVPPEMKKPHECCEVPRPPQNTVSTTGNNWCKYHEWLRKDPSRIAGYEAAINHIFKDGTKEIANKIDGEFCKGFQHPMWFEGCTDGMLQIGDKCDWRVDTYYVSEGALANEECTGNSFFLEGDPMWWDPKDHSKGRKKGIRENFVLAGAVYGSAGVEPTCRASQDDKTAEDEEDLRLLSMSVNGW